MRKALVAALLAAALGPAASAEDPVEVEPCGPGRPGYVVTYNGRPIRLCVYPDLPAATERTRCTADPVGRAVCFVLNDVLP